MNRREALSILTSLPAVSRIEHATLRPSSIIVLTTPSSVSEETAKRLVDALHAVWPEHKCIVLGDGLELRIVDEPK